MGNTTSSRHHHKTKAVVTTTTFDGKSSIHSDSHSSDHVNKKKKHPQHKTMKAASPVSDNNLKKKKKDKHTPTKKKSPKKMNNTNKPVLVEGDDPSTGSSTNHPMTSYSHSERRYSERRPSTATILQQVMDDIKNDELNQSFHNLNEPNPSNEDHLYSKTIGVEIQTSERNAVESLYTGVHDGPVLGYGIGGLVRKITHKVTGMQYALKTLSIEQVETEEGLTQLREEIAILMQLDHPNIVKLEGVYETDGEIFLVQELCEGGDLFDRLDAQPDEHYSEAQCARLVKQMLSAVRYIHTKNIIHRDLKLENFLFDHSGSDSELKMIDFGLSKHFKSGDVHHEPVGTRYTVAPEVLRGSYDESVDVWAIGVITFLLLSGESPFGGCGDQDRSVQEVRYNILNARFAFEPDYIWSHVSEQAKDFIKSILVVDAEKRLTAEQCQHHTWLEEWMNVNTNTAKPLNPNVLTALRSFGHFSDMRKLLCEVIGFTLLPRQISELRREFEKLDVEQSGEITLEGLKTVLLNRTVDGNDAITDGGHNENTASASFLSGTTLSEEEVEDIFNSLRLHENQTHIHWHEFIAAGLSQCSVEERNLRIAFDRIDVEHKGYITFDDFFKFVQPTRIRRRQASMKQLWGDTIRETGDGTQKIEFDDFVKLMRNKECNATEEHNKAKKSSQIDTQK